MKIIIIIIEKKKNHTTGTASYCLYCKDADKRSQPDNEVLMTNVLSSSFHSGIFPSTARLVIIHFTKSHVGEFWPFSSSFWHGLNRCITAPSLHFSSSHRTSPPHLSPSTILHSPPAPLLPQHCFHHKNYPISTRLWL